MTASFDTFTGGLPADLDYMLPARPDDPEMRESAIQDLCLKP